MVQAAERKTAAERREQILDAALSEFARHGYEGASTDAIARAVGISQPYLFRLFGTKKGLYLASAQRCFADTYETFRQASDGLSGEEALEAIGMAYRQLITEDPRRIQAQLQCYAACDDADVCEVARAGFGRLVELVESKGADEERVARFFAMGMLINVMTAMDLYDLESPWAQRLVEGFFESKRS
jgi:AcrR family transcriptional regulator